MIGTIDICVNAANPNLPLKTIFSFKTSPSSLRIIDVPKKIGNWKIDKIYLNINYPNNEVISKDAKLIGGAWVTTFEGSETVGKVEKGYTVFADGVDENNNLIEGYILGKGDVVILNSDGKVEIDNETVNLHLCKDKPESPDTGDVILEDGTYKVYADKKWNSIGDKAYFVNDSIYVDLEIETISFDDYYTKIDNDEEILSNRLYITSSDYTTGFWNRIIEVEDPINKNDAANKKYVDDSKNDTEEKLKLYTDRSVEEINRDLTSNYLPNTTFIPTSTSELNNDANFQNSNQVSDIVENIAYNKDSTYTKNEIDSLISSSIRFKVKEISGDVSMQLEDLTLNHISAYTGQILVLPEKQDGYKRDLQVYLENPLSDTVKWYIDKYNYIDSLENPITASVNSNSKYLYDIQDVDNSDAILVERKSIIEGTYDKGFEPLCFTAEQENSTVKMYCSKGSSVTPAPITLQYSFDKKNWMPYTIDQVITLENIGDKVYFGAGEGGNAIFSGENWQYQFRTTGLLGCTGHVNSLLQLHYNLYNIEIPVNCFRLLFSDSRITSAPILDSTVVGEKGYYSMFNNCYYLINAPELPATQISNSSYSYMFNNCSRLETVPSEIPVTNFPKNACTSMFSNCQKIKTTPKMNIENMGTYSFYKCFYQCTALESSNVDIDVYEIPESGCYEMFGSCTALKLLPELKVSKIGKNGCQSMFRNCNVAQNAPNKIGEDGVGESGCASMFNGCVALSSVPELPATQIGDSAYSYMFQGCNNITEAPELPATTLGTSCYRSMFNQCYKLSKPPTVLPATTVENRAYYNMFTYCYALTDAPTIAATEIKTEGCYQMFTHCTKLSSAPELPATILGDQCYKQMFYGCSNLKTPMSVLPATVLPAVTINNYGAYSGMFQSCSNLSASPEIMADFNQGYVMRDMFRDCKKLSYIKTHAEDWSISSTTQNWLQDASTTGTFVCPESLTIPSRDINGVPEGWTIERF